jgi:hypothetical protein
MHRLNLNQKQEMNELKFLYINALLQEMGMIK